MLLLDSEALSASAHGPALRRDRVRALVGEMRKRELPIATVAAVLAEVIRGRAADAAVFGLLRRERVEVRAVDMRVGVRAGQLLGRAGARSDLAVDAFLVATADLAGGAVIATTDITDLRRLASHARSVLIVDIGGQIVGGSDLIRALARSVRCGPAVGAQGDRALSAVCLAQPNGSSR